MYPESDLFDDELAHLAQSVRGGERALACRQLAAFALELERCIRHEEHTLSTVDERRARTLVKIHDEHASLRRLVAALAHALDRADDRRALELIGKLRSVLLLHVAKEAALRAHTDHAR